MRRLNNWMFDRAHPEFLAGPAVEAVKVPSFSLIFRAGDEDAPARNDGAAVARTRQRHLPTDVLGWSPVKRRFVPARDTVAVTTAERGPVTRRCRNRQQPKHGRPGTAKQRFSGFVQLPNRLGGSNPFTQACLSTGRLGVEPALDPPMSAECALFTNEHALCFLVPFLLPISECT